MKKKYEELQKENRDLYQKVIELEALFNQYLPDMENYHQERKAKAELQNNAQKMLYASTARVGMQRSQEKASQKAKQAALDESPFLDQATRGAMNNGKYCAEYWWSNAIWEEYEITAEDFAKAIAKLLENYGYRVFCTNLFKQKGKIVKVEIMWDWSE